MRAIEVVVGCALCMACDGAATSSAGGGSRDAGSTGTAGGGNTSGAGGTASRGNTSGAGGTAGGGNTSGAANVAGSSNGGTKQSAGGTAGSAPYEPPDGAAYEPCPPKGRPCAIMPLGDSITYGDHGDNTTEGGYRPPLFHLALADGKTITFVGQAMNGPATVDGVPFPQSHDGFPGFTIAGGPPGSPGISSFTAQHVQMYKPQIVTLMIGSNDVRLKYELDQAPERLGALMDIIIGANPHVLLVVAKITPSKSDEINTDADAYNAAIPALVKARTDQGKHVLLVDMNAAFRSNPNYATEYLNDILHPTTAGYAKMGATWYAALSPYLH